MRRTKACGVFVVRGDPVESFLLLVHRKRLDIPKGHVDPGESEMECALRELEEETGISAEDIRLDVDFRFATEYQVSPAHPGDESVLKTLVIFLGRLIRDVPIRLSEHLDYRWCDWNPPHSIQAQTIDPVLDQVERHLQ